jgi:hypothetical protein
MAAPPPEKIQRARRLPDETHHVIVKLETIHVPATTNLDTTPFTHELIGYSFTTPKDDVAGRIQDASIVISTTCPLNAETMGKAPFL